MTQGAAASLMELAVRHGLIREEQRSQLEGLIRIQVGIGQPASAARMLLKGGVAPAALERVLATGAELSGVRCDACGEQVPQAQLRERREYPCPRCKAGLLGFAAFRPGGAPPAAPPAAGSAPRPSSATDRYDEVLPPPRPPAPDAEPTTPAPALEDDGSDSSLGDSVEYTIGFRQVLRPPGLGGGRSPGSPAPASPSPASPSPASPSPASPSPASPGSLPPPRATPPPPLPTPTPALPPKSPPRTTTPPMAPPLPPLPSPAAAGDDDEDGPTVRFGDVLRPPGAERPAPPGGGGLEKTYVLTTPQVPPGPNDEEVEPTLHLPSPGAAPGAPAASGAPAAGADDEESGPTLGFGDVFVLPTGDQGLSEAEVTMAFDSLMAPKGPPPQPLGPTRPGPQPGVAKPLLATRESAPAARSSGGASLMPWLIGLGVLFFLGAAVVVAAGIWYFTR